MAKSARDGTLLKGFVDDYYSKTITGRSLKKAIDTVKYLASPVEPRARKQDRLDLNPRNRKQDRR